MIISVTPPIWSTSAAGRSGKKVRQTIAELGGTMPENLPAVDGIKKLESVARRKELRNGTKDEFVKAKIRHE